MSHNFCWTRLPVNLTLQWGPQHGYGISQSISGRSREVLQVETGSLYPASIAWKSRAG